MIASVRINLEVSVRENHSDSQVPATDGGFVWIVESLSVLKVKFAS